MPKDKIKKKKPPKIKHKSDNHKKLGVPPIGIIDNIVISKNEAWAYYILAEKPYQFLSTDARIALGNSTMTALSGLCQSANKSVNCHLLISNQIFNPDAWEEQIYELQRSYINIENRAFDRFVLEQAKMLRENGYRKRVTYLGVKLFSRGSLDISSINPLEFGVAEAIDTFKKSVSAMFQFSSDEITSHEERRLREAEADIYRILSTSSLRAKRPSAEECLLNIKKRFYPCMPTPYLKTNHDERIGLSDIVIESGGTIEVKPRWLKFTQFIDEHIYESYRATLSLSRLPNDLFFPSPVQPFLHRMSMLPFTVNARFTLLPTEEMKNELNKKKLDTEDEINNLSESGQRPTQSLKDTMGNIQQLEYDLENVKQPWVSGNYRITIEAPNEELLKQIISSLKQEYAKDDFILTWSTGDQLELFREEFLGGKLEMNAFSLTTNMAILGLAGINYGGSVGDPVQQRAKFSNKSR